MGYIYVFNICCRLKVTKIAFSTTGPEDTFAKLAKKLELKILKYRTVCDENETLHVVRLNGY